MTVPDYDDSESDSDNNSSSSGVKTLRGIDRIYKEERRSRLGNAKSLLAVSAAGFVTSILVIVPDDKWQSWVSELKEESNKKPIHQVYIHDRAFAFRTTKLSHNNDYERVGFFNKSRIVLTSYSLLAKEYLTVWKHKGRDGKTSDFFRKHWGLVVLQNREQIPESSHVAKAACMIMTRTGGRRYVIWDDDHWNKKTKKVTKPGGSKNDSQKKRKSTSKIKNGVVLKKKKLEQPTTMTDEETNDEDSSDDEDHYLDDDEEIPPPKQEPAQEAIETTEVQPNLDDASTKTPELASGESSVTDSTGLLDDVLLDVSNEMTSHEFDDAFGIAELEDNTASAST
jgi:hypothetical protein